MKSLLTYFKKLFYQDIEQESHYKYMGAQLSNYIEIINKYGVDSKESAEFLEWNKENKELINLCSGARTLKINLTRIRNEA